MKRTIVTAHSPDDANETHQHRDTRRKRRALIDSTPDLLGRRKARQSTLDAVRSGRNENDDDDEGDEVECRAAAVDLREPFRRQRRHDAVEDHDEDGEEEGLVVCGDVVRVYYGGCCEDHG
jgi:hypothetical protein